MVHCRFFIHAWGQIKARQRFYHSVITPFDVLAALALSAWVLCFGSETFCQSVTKRWRVDGLAVCTGAPGIRSTTIGQQGSDKGSGWVDPDMVHL